MRERTACARDRARPVKSRRLALLGLIVALGVAAYNVAALIVNARFIAMAGDRYDGFARGALLYEINVGVSLLVAAVMAWLLVRGRRVAARSDPAP